MEAARIEGKEEEDEKEEEEYKLKMLLIMGRCKYF
jgi:hypothetical protein